MKEDASRAAPQPSARHRAAYVWRIGGAAYLALVLFATLTPGDARVRLPLACVTCTDLWLLDLLQNVVLFLPLGWLARGAGWSWRHSVLLGAGCSAAIEGTQWAFAGLQRDAILGDWLANSSGAWLGWVAPGVWRWWTRSLPRARRVAVWLLWSGGLLGGGMALAQPALPTDADWYAQAAAELGHLDRWTGAVRGARVNAQPVPFQLRPERVLSARTADARLTLSAEVGAARPTRRLAPIVSVYDGQQREVAVLGGAGDELLLRVRTRAGAMGLRDPLVRIRWPASREADGRALRSVAATIEGRRWCISTEGTARCTSVSPAALLAAQTPWHDQAGEGGRLAVWLGWLVVGLAVGGPAVALRRP